MEDEYGPLFTFSSPYTTFHIGIATPPNGVFTLSLRQRAFLRFVGSYIRKHHASQPHLRLAESYNALFGTHLSHQNVDNHRRKELSRRSVFRKIRDTPNTAQYYQRRKSTRQAIQRVITQAQVVGFEASLLSTASSTLNSTHRRNMEIRAVSKSLGVSNTTRSFIHALHPAVAHVHDGKMYDVLEARATVRAFHRPSFFFCAAVL